MEQQAQSSSTTTELIYCEVTVSNEKEPTEQRGVFEKEGAQKVLVLRLQDRKVPKIRWEEGTVDNEHLCRKSSKSMTSLF